MAVHGRSGRVLAAAVAALLLTGAGGCARTGTTAANRASAVVTADAEAAPVSPPTGKISDLSTADLRDVLAQLDKGHHDKMKLGWWVNAPLLRSADPIFKKFYKERAEIEKTLAKELEDWAKSRHLDITYHYGTDTFGQAQKIMEERQEKLVRADNKEDFDRDMLIDEWQDYEFTVSLLTALQPAVRDPALRAYVATALRSAESGSAEVLGYLKKFKFTG